jgi:hypothetical protein
MAATTTILTENVTTTNATWDQGHPIVDPGELEDVLGWSLTPEGLC